MKWFACLTVSLLLISPAHAWDGCYYGDTPHTNFQNAAGPIEIEVYYDSSFSNAPYIGTAGTHISVAAAKNIVTSVLSRMPAEASANFTFRIMAGNPPVADCDDNSSERANPYVIIFGDPDESFCCPANTCGACAGSEQKAGTNDMKCGRIHFRLDVGYNYFGTNGNEFMRLLTHELMHVFRFEHQDDATTDCAVTHPQNLNDLVNVCNNGAALCTAATTVPRRHVTRAMRNYFQADYGRDTHDLREYHGSGFGPPSWTYSTLQTGILGPTATTEGTSVYSGYVYNKYVGGSSNESRVLLYDTGGWTSEEIPTALDSFYRPDIARTIGLNPNLWMTAILGYDSREVPTKYVQVSQRSFGAAGWASSYVTTASGYATTENYAVAIAFDPISGNWLLSLLNNSNEIVLYTRSAGAGGNWTQSAITNGGGGAAVTAYDGADIACSAWANTDTHNCVAVYTTADTGSAIKYVPFHISAGVAACGNVTAGDSLLGVSRPSVTANPSNADPKFQYAFSQGGTTVYTRLQNRNSASWSGGTPVSLPYRSWAPPAGLGAFDSTTDLVVAP
jgi:hypothetical protein